MAKKRTSMATKIKNPKPATSLSDLMAGANIKATEDTKEDTEVKEEKVEETKETVSEETKSEAQIEHEKAKEDLEAKWAEEERIKEEIRQGHLNKIQRAEETFEEGDIDVKKQVLDKFEKDVNDYLKENMHGDVKTNYEAALFRMQHAYDEALAKQQEEVKVEEPKVEEVVEKVKEEEETTQPFEYRKPMETVERPKSVQPQNPNVWFCPNCGNGNTGASCVICGTPRPKAPKKKLKLDDKAEVFDPTILEGLEDYEDVVINGTARKNINIKNWLFRFLNSKKTRKMSVSDCIERAVIEYYKDEVKEINKAIRETLANDEDAVDQICYNSKKVEEVRAMIKARNNKR